MADTVADPKIKISVEHQAALKAFLETGAASKDLGKALAAMSTQFEASAGKATASEKGFARFERTISQMASELKGNGATAQLNMLALALEKAGGKSALTAAQLDNLRAKIESLRSAGGSAPAGLAGLTSGTEKLEAAGKALAGGQGLSGALSAISPAAVGAAAGVAALAAASAALATKVGEAVMQTAAYAEQIKNLSDSYNINTTAVQRLAAAADAADVPIESLMASVSKIQKGLVETPEKFRELGLSVDELIGLSPDEQFYRVAEAIAAIENPTLQSAAALDILGRGGSESLRLLKTDMREVGDEAERMGRVMSEDQIKQAAALKDEIDKLGKTWEHLKLNLATVITGNEDVAESIASISAAIGALSRMVQQNADKIRQGLGLGVAAVAAGNPGVDKLLTLGKAARAASEALQLLDAANDEVWLEDVKQRGPKPPGISLPEGGEALGLLGKGLDADIKQTRDEIRRDAEAAAAKAKRDAEELAKWTKDQLSKEEEEVRKTYEAEIKAGEDYADWKRDQLSKEEQEVRKTLEHEQADTLKSQKERAESIKGAAAARREAARYEMSDAKAVIDRIEERRQVALAALDAEIKKRQENADVLGEEKDAVNDLAEAEAREARQQELISNIEQVQEGFGELINIFDQLGVAADSGLGKAARAGEELAGAGVHAAKAWVAAGKGDYIGAVVEGLKSLGDVISAVKTVFSKPEWKRVAEDVGRDMGVSISQGLAESIAKDSKRLGDRLAGTLLHLKDIIEEAGGLEAFGTDKAVEQLRTLFSVLDRGEISVREAGKAFDDVFGDLAESVTRGGALASKQFLELISLSRQFGIESQKLNEYLDRQAEAGIKGLRAFISNAKVTLQGAAEAIGAGLAGAYNILIQQGKSPSEAFAELQPDIEKFQKQLEEAGLTGGVAFEQMQARAALFADEVKGPALDAVHGLTDFLGSLHNMGLLNQETFGALAGQVTATADALREQGEIGPAALAALAPDLQKIWELQQNFGYSVDAGTQALLDQAVAADLVGATHESAQDRMVSAAERTANAMEALARAMGVVLPEAARRGAQGVNDALDTINDRDVTLRVRYDTGNLPNPNDLPPIPGFAGGSGGLRDYGAGTLAVLHGSEAVLTREQYESRQGSPVTINMGSHSIAVGQGSQGPEADRALAERISEMLRVNDNAAAERVRRIVDDAVKRG